MGMSLIAGFGASVLPDAVEAGRQAAELALRELDGSEPALVLVFASTRYPLQSLIKSIRETTGDVPLAGATSSGSFQDGVLTPPGDGVAVLAVTAGQYRFGVASVAGLGGDPEDAGRRLARAARASVDPQEGAHSALLLLADGLGGDLQLLLSGIYRVTGARVPVVGGAAADDRKMTQTFVFHDNQVLADGAVAVWIESDHPLKVVARHGWHAVTLPMIITRVDGQIVHEVGGRPAAEIYREHADAARVADTGLPDGYHSSHAFGLIEADGSHLIRGAFTGPDDLLRTFAPLPPYGAVEVVSCRPDDLLDVTEEVVTEALAGQDAHLLLTFSCVARLDILGARTSEEVARLQAAAGAVRTFGFYTYGEFARTNSVAGFHNATITAIAL